MPAPSSPSTFERPDLGRAYEEFDLAAHIQGFIGPRLMPMTPVALQAANFSKIKLKELLDDDRRDQIKRAPGAAYARGDWDFTQDSYACEERGAEEVLDDRERAAYGYTGIRFDQIAANRAVALLMRDLEIEIQTIAQDATTYAAQSNGVSTEWDTHASATPVADVLAARESFKGSCGMYPNVVCMSEKVAQNALQTDELRDYIKYVERRFPDSGLGGQRGVGMKMSDLLAQAFRVDEVLISPAVKSTAGPKDTPVIADIWDDEYVTLLRRPEGDDLRSPGFGRTMSFQDLVLEQYRDEKHRGDVMRARFDIDVKVIHSECLWILSNITT